MARYFWRIPPARKKPFQTGQSLQDTNGVGFDIRYLTAASCQRMSDPEPHWISIFASVPSALTFVSALATGKYERQNRDTGKIGAQVRIAAEPETGAGSGPIT